MKFLLEDFSIFSLIFLGAIYLWPGNPDLLHHQELGFAVVASLVLALMVGRATDSIIAFLASLYFLLHSALTWARPGAAPPWAKIPASGSYLLLALALVVGVFAEKEIRRKLLNALALLAPISAGVMIYLRLAGKMPIFFLNNPAADGCALAVLAPLVLFRSCGPGSWLSGQARAVIRGFTGLLILAAVALSGSTTAVVALTLSVTVYFAAEWKAFGRLARPGKTELVALALIVVTTISGLLKFTPDDPLDSDGRAQVWRAHYQFLTRQMSPEALECLRANTTPENSYYMDQTYNVITGAGSGSFYPLSGLVQMCNGQYHGSIFPFAHNDPFEVWFTDGWIGLVFLLLVGARALYLALDRPWLFAALFTYGATSLVQFPFRYPGSALLGVLLVRESFGEARAPLQQNKFYLYAARVLESRKARIRLLLARVLPSWILWNK